MLFALILTLTALVAWLAGWYGPYSQWHTALFHGLIIFGCLVIFGFCCLLVLVLHLRDERLIASIRRQNQTTYPESQSLPRARASGPGRISVN